MNINDLKVLATRRILKLPLRSHLAAVAAHEVAVAVLIVALVRCRKPNNKVA